MAIHCCCLLSHSILSSLRGLGWARYVSRSLAATAGRDTAERISLGHWFWGQTERWLGLRKFPDWCPLKSWPEQGDIFSHFLPFFWTTWAVFLGWAMACSRIVFKFELVVQVSSLKILPEHVGVHELCYSTVPFCAISYHVDPLCAISCHFLPFPAISYHFVPFGPTIPLLATVTPPLPCGCKKAQQGDVQITKCSSFMFKLRCKFQVWRPQPPPEQLTVQPQATHFSSAEKENPLGGPLWKGQKKGQFFFSAPVVPKKTTLFRWPEQLQVQVRFFKFRPEAWKKSLEQTFVEFTGLGYLPYLTYNEIKRIRTLE